MIQMKHLYLCFSFKSLYKTIQKHVDYNIDIFVAKK